MIIRRWAGHVLRWGLPIGAIGYLGYLLANSDPTRLLEHLQPMALFVAAACAVIYCCAFYLLAAAWGLTLRRFAGAPLDFSAVIHAYALANFAKYLPGNVFHYVGRQVAAARLGCGQRATAQATVTEIAMHLVSAGCILVLLLPFASDDLYWLHQVSELTAGLWPLALMGATVGGGAVLYLYLRRGRRALPRLDFRLLTTVLCLQLIFFVVATSIGTWLAIILLQAPISSLPAIAFAHLLAWLIAFVTPGAPAGLGVREACLAAALQVYGEPSIILIVVALSRVVLIAGDGLFALSAHLLLSKAERPAPT